MHLLCTLVQHASSEGKLNSLSECSLIASVCRSAIEDSVKGKGSACKKFATEVLDGNADVMFAFCKSLANFVENCTNLKHFAACFDIIESLPILSDDMALLFVSDFDEEQVSEMTKHAKDAYQAMFLAYLNLLCKIKSEMPGKASVQSLLKRTLVSISKTIIPRLASPLLLADFLLTCLDDKTDLSN